MNVMFDMVNGSSFIMEVGTFDSVLEMKHKIQSFTGIPVWEQVLDFEGNQLLDDTRSVLSCFIGPGSHVLLHIMNQDECQAMPPSLPLPLPPLMTVDFVVRLPYSTPRFSLPIDPSDSVQQLKHILHTHAIPGDRLGLYINGLIELEDDHKCLNDYGVSDGSVIDVFIKPYLPILDQYKYQDLKLPFPTPEPEAPKTIEILIVDLRGNPLIPISMNLTDSVLHLKQKFHEKLGAGFFPTDMQALYFVDKKIELQDDKCLSEYGLSDGVAITVLSKRSPPSERFKIQVVTPCNWSLNLEVTSSEKVRVLRKEIERLDKWLKFELSPGYVFTNKQKVMDEKRSFNQNKVNWGDKIEISNGNVSFPN